MPLSPDPSPRGRGATHFHHRLSVTLSKTGFERIDQTLSYLSTRHQAIDQHIDACEVVTPVIVRGRKIDLLAFVPKSREAPLHQAHDVGRDLVTRRLLCSPPRRVAVSPRLCRILVAIRFHLQSRIGGKQNEEA